MKMRNIYSKLSKTIYEFDQFDVRDALLVKAGLSKYEPERDVRFDWSSNDDGILSVTITVVYETERKDE